MESKLTVLLTLVLCMFCSRSFAQPPENVKIGLIFPLSGPMGSFGQDIARAVPLLEKRFNSQQTKYHFSLALEDGMFGHSNAAITAAKKLVDVDGVRFLVTGSSGETLQVAPFAESRHILTVAGFASHPDMRKAGDFIFRTYIDADDGIQILSDALIHDNIAKVAVITETSSFSMAIKASLENYLKGRVVFADDYAFGETDFSTLLFMARKKHPQVYYLNTASPASFVALFRKLRELGATERVYTYYVPSLPEVQAALGDQLDGTFYLDYPDVKDSSPDFESFLSEFRATNTNDVTALFNFRTNYNAIKVIFDAIMEVGPDSEKAKDFLYSYDRPSATGRLRFDQDGDAIGLKLALKLKLTPKVYPGKSEGL